MDCYTFSNWHAWQGSSKWFLSDELRKELREFDNFDQVINFLYLRGEKSAARAYWEAWQFGQDHDKAVDRIRKAMRS